MALCIVDMASVVCRRLAKGASHACVVSLPHEFPPHDYPGFNTTKILTCTQMFNELSARETIDPGDLSPLQAQLDALESDLLDLEMYEVKR